jgi:putative ABC transport system ATP-binding protein
MNNQKQITNLVELNQTTKIFRNKEVKTVAVDRVSLRAFPGELLLLLGPSGSGKTLTLIAGLAEPTSGTVSLFGIDIRRYPPKELQKLRAARIGFIFQTFLLIDSLTVLENVGVVLRFTGKSKKEARKMAVSLLKDFHIDHLAKKFPNCLSQGEKQRVAIARAIANDTQLILADEPTGSLESKQGLHIIKLLHHLAKHENKCVIISTHDLRLVEHADRIIHLEDGKIIRCQQVQKSTVGSYGVESPPGEFSKTRGSKTKLELLEYKAMEGLR